MLSGEERRTSKLSSAVGTMALGCQCFLDLVGRDRYSGVHPAAKIRSHVAASRSTRSQDLEVQMVGARVHRRQAQETHKCHRLLEKTGDL